MSINTGLYRTTLPNGTEVVYVDKGAGTKIALMPDRYIEQGYEPSFDSLPVK